MSGAGNSALRRGIERVVLLYAAFAAGWILLSDKALEWLVSDPSLVAVAGTLKGWVFVAISSLLLYGGLRRLAGGSGECPPSGSPRTMLVAMALVVALVAGFAIRNTTTHHLKMETARLEAVADAKAGQLSDWLRERQGEGEIIRTSLSFADLYRQWREGGSAAAERLQAWLEKLRRVRGFAAVSLLDSEGSLLWSGGGADADPDPELQAAARAAIEQGRVLGLALHRDRNGKAWMVFLVPMAAVEPHPVLVLQATPSEWFGRALQDWPLPDVGGEILLFHRDRDRVRVFSRPDSPVPGEVPGTDWPWDPTVPGSIQSVREGRGPTWIGVVRPVPGTDWMLLAKVDRAAMYRPAVRDALWIALAGALLLFTAGVVLMLQRQRERLAVVEAVRLSQDQRLRAMQLLAAIADASEEAIYAKDLEGRYVLFNRAAGEFVGKPTRDVLGRDDRALFPSEQARMVMEADRLVVREGRFIYQEEVLDTARGKRVFSVVKGPLRDEQGRIFGIYGISRDISERKVAEQELRRQTEELARRNQELERFNRATVGRELDMIALKRQLNELSRQLGREPPYPLEFLQADPEPRESP